MDPAYDLARNVVQLEYRDLPKKVVEAAKLQVLDTLGVAIAGSNEAGVRELLQLLKGIGGKEEASVIANATRLPAPYAAQVNATMSHALDYDDTHLPSVSHLGCVVVPTALSMAEAIGKVSGKDCITAIALGADLIVRIGTAAKYERGIPSSGWHFTPLHGIFGAVAVASRLLKLDEGKVVNALGLAYHQAAGNLQCTTDGALAKRLGPGFAARNGIMSATMAAGGITGARNCFEGKRGIYQIYHGRAAYDRAALLQGIGKRFEGAYVAVKPYPCCRATHVSIDATLALVKGYDIRPDDVHEITVFGGETEYSMCTPLDVKAKPRSTVDAQFSIPWVVGTAICRRAVTMADFTQEAIANEDVLRVAGKVKGELTPEFVTAGFEPVRIRIVADRGTFVKQVDIAYGDPENPMGVEDLVRKFRDCASYCAKPLSKESVDNLIEAIMNLEELDDAAQMMRLMN